MSTPHFSLPRMSIDARHLSTVRKCRRYHSSLPCVKYRLSTPLYRAKMSTPNSTLPCVSIDSPDLSTVRKYRRSTLRYNSLQRANIYAKHLVTVRREYWSNLLRYLVSFLFKRMRRGGSGYLLFWLNGWELVHSKQWCISTCCFGLFWSSVETVPFGTHETKNKVNTWNITSFLFSKYAIFLFYNFNSLNTLPL